MAAERAALPDEGQWPCQFETEVPPPPRLVATLYRLLRDHVPPGDLEQVLIEIKDDTHETRYTNRALRDLAVSHAGYLMEQAA